MTKQSKDFDPESYRALLLKLIDEKLTANGLQPIQQKNDRAGSFVTISYNPERSSVDAEETNAKENDQIS